MRLREMRAARGVVAGIAVTLALAGWPVSAVGTPPATHQSPAGAEATDGTGGGDAGRRDRILQVTRTVQCFCGTCVNQTLDECTCGVASRERGRVAAAIDSGQEPAAVIEAYVAEHGPQVLIVPERSGLNLIGWAIPFLASGIGLIVLVIVLVRWTRRAPAEPPQHESTADGDDPTQQPYRERLARDLEDMDRC